MYLMQIFKIRDACSASDGAIDLVFVEEFNVSVILVERNFNSGFDSGRVHL